jgi:hypothetical protein
MADFNQTRNDLVKARNDREAAGEAVASERDHLRRVLRESAQLDRAFDPQNQEHVTKRQQLDQQISAANSQLAKLKQTHGDLRQTEANLFAEFSVFTDPRKAIENFDDGIPILMMPVRLETRFKTGGTIGAAGQAPQLWLRIYPDDCWIDTFDSVLTETEVANAKNYWIGIWKAGEVEPQERAAWKDLVESHGAGRAKWIVSEFKPLNLASKPTKPEAKDVRLTIPTETPLNAIEEPHVLDFWRDLWLADTDQAAIDAAHNTLLGFVGQARLDEILAQYQPVNFSDPLPEGVTKADVDVAAAVVLFGPANTKQNAWARAPRIDLMPDRFVFIGYEGKNATALEFGKPVLTPLIAGPDPTAPANEQLRHDANGQIIIPDEMKWMTDFDRAVEVGMGMRINLTPSQAANGFTRVLVVGLRTSSDENKAKTELETLFLHHSNTRKGFAVIPQGTPTNNTETVSSGFGRGDDPDESFDDLKDELFQPSTNWLDKRDGQWIAEYLGIDPEIFKHVHGAGSTDQLTARAMNIALWPATFGYWMEGMMSEVFTRDGIEQTRDFFNRYVIGGGAIPAIRIGSQPYGILPATTISNMSWWVPRDVPGIATIPQDPLFAYLRRLYPILQRMYSDWGGDSFLGQVSFVGKNGDPHDLLTDIVGLHSGSVEWSQRYAHSLKALFNMVNFSGLGEDFSLLKTGFQFLFAAALLQELGAPSDAQPLILEKVFLGKHNLLKGGVVDDKPLSETSLIRAYAPGDKNYIQWLIEAANASLNALYAQDGFINDKPPTALLYIMLRHALQLGYDDVSIRLRQSAGLLTAEAARLGRIDSPFLHIKADTQVSESRYQPLFSPAPAITQSATMPLHEFIAAGISNLQFAFYMREQLAALERLKVQSTARLERAFADHIDCCSYRLDAWLLSLVNYQLRTMRNIREVDSPDVRQGIYLGAYAWLENLKPENKVMTPVQLDDPELIKEFLAPGQPPLMRDSTNQGYIHAPSLNHAVAAAVLRNGYISNASPANRQTMAVNLTSERARTAIAMLEGIRGGQGLADLLGYQFERGLHDRHGLAEVDKFIFKLRKAFPLRADKMGDTKSAEGEPIENIEARNVIDGLALVEHMKKTGNKTYPFGKPATLLPPVDVPAQADAINAEADRLLETHDAVADLALAEGIYQAVLGNYDRVASTYDAYARGNFPPEPDIVRTPLNGIGITHRVGLQLETVANPQLSPILLVPVTPRSLGEPALNNWLAGLLPLLEKIVCVVDYFKASTNAPASDEVSLFNLELQPLDILGIIREGNEQAMAELDDRILRYVFNNLGPRPDKPIVVKYLDKQTATAFPIFEVIPLVRSLRRLTTRSRALKSTDLALTIEATNEQDSQPFVDKTRLDLVRGRMEANRNALAGLQTTFEGPLADLAVGLNEILTTVDQRLDNLVTLLAEAALFVVPQAGWGFAYDFRQRVYTAILKQAADLVVRWDEKLAEFNARLNEESALPGTATEAERFAILLKAEQAISTTTTDPLPATSAAFRADLINIKAFDFTNKRNDFDSLKNSTHTQVSALLAQIKGFGQVDQFDPVEFSLKAHEDEMVRFTEDAVSVIKVVVAELNRRLLSAADLLTADGNTAEGVARLEQAAKVLLGEDFRILPEFQLTAAQGNEFENALNASRGGALFTHLTTPPDPAKADPFPVDTWLYGVARVREKLQAWEQTVMLCGGLGIQEPQLEALQLPFIAGDHWLGLEFPPDQKLDQERLLYTARLPVVFNKTARQCGLLLDEWSEIIPTSEVDTGIATHYDRPNCEAPQAMLLVTPTQFTGSWTWEELIDALNETLEFAKRRAVEPSQIDATPYGPFLPATITASQVVQLTIAANFALNNAVAQAMQTP